MRTIFKELVPGHPSLKGLEPHGTRVTLRLRESVDIEKQSVLDIVRHWIILPPCPVIYIEKGKNPQRIGFDSASAALRHFRFESLPERKGENYEIIETSADLGDGAKYELAFAVRKVQFTPERNFVGRGNLALPAVCIEGIHADSELPGFGRSSSISALLSVRWQQAIPDHSIAHESGEG